MVGVERFDKSKLQTADQPKQSLAKSKDMTLVILYIWIVMHVIIKASEMLVAPRISEYFLKSLKL